MPPSTQRQQAWKVLAEVVPEFELVREIEAHVHASALDASESMRLALQCSSSSFGMAPARKIGMRHFASDGARRRTSGFSISFRRKQLPHYYFCCHC